MRFLSKMLVLALPFALISGCSSTGTTKEQVSTTDTSDSSSMVSEETAGSSASAEPMGIQSSSGFVGDPLDDPANALASRVVYFDFDKSDIRQESRDTIAAHSSYLVDNPSASIIIEGHADERGTREYNIALGERRGKAIGRFMALQGVAERQVEVVSFGEERPVALGHDEASWQLNRRAEIIYQGR